MTSTFVNNLALNEMATGDQSGSWGTVTNLNLELIGEGLGFATEAPFNTDANKTTTVAPGASDPARAMYFKVTSTVSGGLTATRQLTIDPDTINRLMFIENATTGGESITIKQGSGSGAAVTIPNGDTKAVILSGSGSGSIVLDAFASLSVVDLNVSGAVQIDNTLSVGVDDTGYDVKFFGATASAFMQWDASADDLILGGAAGLSVNSAALVTGVLTTTAATVFNGGFASNAGSTITRNDNGAQLTLISTDTDELSGPVLDLYRNSGAAIDGDNIGQINFFGENTSDQKHQYLYLFSEILDATANEEDVRFVIGGLVAGADSSLFEYTSTAGSGNDPKLVFNNTGRNINFIVKSDGNANMLFVDGEEDRVGIGIATPSTPLEVNGIATMDSARLSSNSGSSYWDIRRDSSTGHFVIKDDGLGDVLIIKQDTGNIGIGIATPLSTVHIEDNGGAVLTLGNSQNPPDVNANTVFGRINFFASDRSSSTNATGGVARIEALASAGYSNTSPADLLFYTHAASANDGSVLGTPAEALRINSSGDVIIANTGGTLITTTAAGTDSNLRLGANAGNSIAAVGGTAAGTLNVLVGNNAGTALTTGYRNTVVGAFAGDALNTGHNNIAIGLNALTLETSGFESIAIGSAALNLQNGGQNNIAIGFNSLTSNLTGLQNVAVGNSSGLFATTAEASTFIGHNAGAGVTGAKLTGNNNTAVGKNAGTLLQGTAQNNTFLGVASGSTVTTGDANVCLGYNAGVNQISTADNLLYIARASTAAGNDGTWIHGTASGACINGDNATAWAQTSDRRIKKNIADSSVGLSKINQVKVRNFEYRTFDELDDDVKALNDGNGLNVISKSGTKTGVIAQEIEAIFPSDVQDLADGTKIVTPSDLNYALIKAVQELSTALDAALARITTLEG